MLWDRDGKDIEWKRSKTIKTINMNTRDKHTNTIETSYWRYTHAHTNDRIPGTYKSSKEGNRKR